MKINWKPCPLCGESDKVEVTTKEFYSGLVAEHGDALICIECKRCKVRVDDYPSESGRNNYEWRLMHMAKKWNGLPRRLGE